MFVAVVTILAECAAASQLQVELLDTSMCYMFERIHPEMRSDSSSPRSSPAVPASPVSYPSRLVGRIVLPYTEPQLVHIGTRSTIDFHERCPRSTPTGAPHACRHLELHTVEQCIQAAADLEWNQSEGKMSIVGYADCYLTGFVIRDKQFNRVKALSLHPSPSLQTCGHR